MRSRHAASRASAGGAGEALLGREPRPLVVLGADVYSDSSVSDTYESTSVERRGRELVLELPGAGRGRARAPSRRGRPCARAPRTAAPGGRRRRATAPRRRCASPPAGRPRRARGRRGRRGGGPPTRRSVRPRPCRTDGTAASSASRTPGRRSAAEGEKSTVWSSGGACTSTGTPKSVSSIVISAVPAPAPNEPPSIVMCIFTTRSWPSIQTSAGTVPSLANASRVSWLALGSSSSTFV